VAATNRDLAAMVADRQFRSDLYYRLNVFPIVNPPLRERPEDISTLAHHFMEKFAARLHKRLSTIPVGTMTALRRYHWPGNIRELEHLVERAVILSRGSTLEIPLNELNGPRTDQQSSAVTLKEAEREHIFQALQDANWMIGGRSGAAARLGIKRTTLQSMMSRLGIERPSRRLNPEAGLTAA
jgi:formate hydrogenlyase transcriptional activator